MPSERMTTPRLRELFGADTDQQIPERVSTPQSSGHTIIELDLPSDPLLREHQRMIALRRRTSQVSHIGAVATVMAAQVTDSGLRVTFDIPLDATPCDLHAVARLDLCAAVGVLVPIAESLASLHDAGLAHGGIAASTIMQRPDGSGFIVGFDGRETSADDVAAMGSLVLDAIPSGSLPGEVAALLLRAIDTDADLRPSMSEIARVFAGVCRRTMVSPPARRRRPESGDPAADGHQPAPPIVTRADSLQTHELSPLSIARSRPHRHTRQRHSSPRGALPAPVLVGLASSAGTWILALLILGRG